MGLKMMVWVSLFRACIFLVCAVSSIIGATQAHQSKDIHSSPAIPTITIEPYNHARDYEDLYRLFNENTANLGINMLDYDYLCNRCVKVVRINEYLGGFIMYKKYESNGYISYVAVDSNVQNYGLGKLLLNHAINDLKSQGAADVSLCVFHHNRKAQSLYERLGFHMQSISNGLLNYALNFA